MCKKYLPRSRLPQDEAHAALCDSCTEFNAAKRQLVADLRGRIALVTGGRVKIGYRVALKLLRLGCTVVVTTRCGAAKGQAARADRAAGSRRTR